MAAERRITMNAAFTREDGQDSLILVIDDSIENIRLLSNILKGQARVIFATSGREGLALARERKPHVILMDIEMPDMNGYEVCRKLKLDVDTSNCAIIFITAHSGMSSEIDALESGGVDFITKPLNPLVVKARVNTHLILQRQAEELLRLASRDSLTGLYNRRHFDQQLAREFERHRRQGLPLGLAFIDVDNFKAYNDGYGHVEGDKCLRTIADAIGSASRRPGEIVARYGGEEFVTILPYTSHENVQKYGEWICVRIRELALEHRYSTTSSLVTISVGMTSMVPGDDRTVDQMIDHADRALYRAKSAGRDCAKMDI